MCGTADRSSLYHPGFHRQELVPAVRPSCRATSEASLNCDPATTSEVSFEFGDGNPFIVPSKGVQGDFEMVVLICAIAFVAVISGLTAFLMWEGA